MLKLNVIGKGNKERQIYYLNTSYVKVKLVHLLLFLGQYRYLNTSYVKVKQSKWQNRCKLSKI